MSSNGHHVDDGGESSSVMSGTSSFSTTDDMDEESRIPPWKKWSDSMKCLLEDPTGCGLFQKFLTEENLGGAFLFYHACKGLKSQEKTKQHKLQLIRAIQEKFVLTPHVLPLHEDTKMMLVEKFESLRKGLVADSELVNFFDGAQEEAWSIMERDHYPNFISSETYQHYINSQEKDEDSPPAVSTRPVSEVKPPTPPPVLPLSLPAPFRPPVPPPRHLPNLQRGVFSLTKEALAGTVESRVAESEKKTEQIWQQGHANMPYHSKYAPYVLPSARESELQSHVSDSNRQKKHVDPVNRDILDFDVAKQMAQLNIVQQEERLPTTMNQRLHPGVNPREMDPKKPPLEPKVLANELIEKLKVVQSGPIHYRFQLNSLPVLPKEPDDSDNILEQHLRRVGKSRTPDSYGSMSSSPQPPVRHWATITLPSNPPPLRPPKPPSSSSSTFPAGGKQEHRIPTLPPAKPDYQYGGTFGGPMKGDQSLEKRNRSGFSGGSVMTTPQYGGTSGTAYREVQNFAVPKPVKKDERVAVGAVRETSYNTNQILQRLQPNKTSLVTTDSGYAGPSDDLSSFVSHPYQNVPPVTHQLSATSSTRSQWRPSQSRGSQSSQNENTKLSPHQVSRNYSLPQSTQGDSEQGRQITSSSSYKSSSRSRSSNDPHPPRRTGERDRERTKGSGIGSGNGGSGDDNTVTVLWRVGDKGEFYMTKVTGRNVTLRSFKNALPKDLVKDAAAKYFFQREMVLPGNANGFVWDEIKLDSCTLPRYGDRIWATVYSSP